MVLECAVFERERAAHAPFLRAAAATQLPEQQETIHTIQMLRQEDACRGLLDGLAHVRTVYVLAFTLTKRTAKPDTLACPKQDS